MGTDRMGGPWRAAVLESRVVSRAVGPQSAALLVFGSTLGPSTLSDLASPPHNPPSDCFPVLASLRSDTDLQPGNLHGISWALALLFQASPLSFSLLLPLWPPKSHASVCLALTFPVTSQLSPCVCFFLCLCLSPCLALSLAVPVSCSSRLLFLFSPYLFLSLCLCVSLSVCIYLQVSLP